MSIIGFFGFLIIRKSNKNDEALFAAGYMTMAEIFFRMTGAAFFYELGKYSVIAFLLFGMFYIGNSKKAVPYWVYLILLIPGIVVASMTLNLGTDVRDAIAFNLSGPMCLGFSALYCYYRKISFTRLKKILMVMLLPVVTITAYLYLYTPSIGEALSSGTGSNFAASGGFGPNQVSTILGLGMFILFSRLFTSQSKLNNLIDLSLLVLVSYRAVITFSRGGVITAIVCMIAFLLLFFMNASPKIRQSILPRAAIIVGALVVTWIFTSILTMGLIDKRYTNKDAAGRLKQDITTGRAELVETELNAFYTHPFFGIGVGKVREYRYEKTEILAASHNEFSRLLSEHGLMGIFALLIIFFTPLIYFILVAKKNPFFLAFFLFWFFTINHSSMRIAAPAFVYGLCLLYVVNEKKNNLHRKQISR
ncbi:MAG TPA: O-antigen ligase family protein [Salinimicrobium sp.]|nr:O-antigen ligase family protein [Salinimicrobium sp.]